MPALALRLMEGNLADISPRWSGWSLRDGTLCSPEGYVWTVETLNA